MSTPSRPLTFRLEGRRALVTGAGRGIGEACAIALAEAGADVVLVSRTEDDLRRVAAHVDAAGGRAETVVCDVTSGAEIRERIAALDGIDVLVNSAGTNIPEPFVEVSEEHLDALLDLNVKGTFLVTQAVAGAMMDAGRSGAIVNMSSQMGHVGAPRRTVYCATKHAVEGLTKALAVELAPHSIRVNSVAPTYVETEMTRPFFENPEFLADTLARIPLARLGTVADVAGAVVYLASDAAGLVTGTSLLVDGGYTAR